METEKRLSGYVTDTAYEELPEEPIGIAKDVILTILGTTPDFPAVRDVTIADGAFFTQDQTDRKLKVAVLGSQL